MNDVTLCVLAALAGVLTGALVALTYHTMSKLTELVVILNAILEILRKAQIKNRQ